MQFESLPKLSQTKSANGKMTILDYIVETFIKKEEKNVLLLMEEFPDIQVSLWESLAFFDGQPTSCTESSLFHVVILLDFKSTVNSWSSRKY